MLQRIRDKSSGWIAYLILGAVIITMAFFGLEAYFSPKIETYAAKVEGPATFWIFGKQEREISQDEFRRRYRSLPRSRQADVDQLRLFLGMGGMASAF